MLTRAFDLSGGTVNFDTGEFPLVVASTGEASDHHILNVDGMPIRQSMPMLFAHESTPTIPSLGIMHQMRADDLDGLRVMRTVGKFDQSGDGPIFAVIRDIMHLVDAGSLPSASLRWSGPSVPRSSLDRSHFAYDASGFGQYFHEPRMTEGSIVAIGADPVALNGRADAAESEPQRMFWRVLAEEVENEDGQRGVATAVLAFMSAVEGLQKVGCTNADALRLSGISEDEELRKYEGVLIPATIEQGIRDRESRLLGYLMREGSVTRESDAQDDSTRESAVEDAARESDESALIEKPERTLADVLAEVGGQIPAALERGKRQASYEVLGR